MPKRFPFLLGLKWSISLKIKIFLIIAFVAIFFTQFNFYSKTYLSITTDDRVSEYQLILKDSQQNVSHFSQQPPTDYPFFYIFNEHYIDTFQSVRGYFTSYFPLPTETKFENIKIILSSLFSIEIQKICLHNSLLETCWNKNDISNIFEINTSNQKTTLAYKGNFQNIQQQFLTPNYLKSIVIISIILVLAISIYFFSKDLIIFSKPQVIFFWLGAVFGTLTCFINPLTKVPDEPYHLSQAVYLTQPVETTSNSQCAYFPANAILSIAELHWHYLYKKPFLLPQDSFNYFSSFPIHSQHALEMKYSKHYFFFSYYPSALGIYLGKILDLSWFETIYLARLINFFVWLLCTYLAISLIPFGKWLLLLIALSPMSVFQAAAISVDGLTNSLSFLLTALILKFVIEEQKRGVLLLIISSIAIFLTLTKFPYLILMSLLFLVFTQQPQRFKSYLPISLAGVAIILIVLGVMLFLGKNSEGIIGIASKQILGIFEHPLTYWGIILETFKREGFILVNGWVGIFGWLETFFPLWFVVLHIVVLSLYGIISLNDKIMFTFLSKILIFIIFILGILTIFTTLYIIESPHIELPYIDGIQGRYFIPLGVLPFLLFQNQKFTLSDQILQKLTLIYIPFSLIFMLITISNYYRI